MEKLREKRIAMQEQLEEVDKREKLANKKQSRLSEIIEQHERERNTLRTSCRFNAETLEKREDLLDEKLHSLKCALLKKDKEDQFIKVLMKKEEERDDETCRLEPKVKKALQRADEAEMKYHEVVSKLALAESEYLKVKARQEEKEELVRKLEDSLKTAGRQIRHLEVQEEKSGDREDQKFHYCRQLIDRVDQCIMRAEEAERRIRMLQKQYDTLEAEKTVYDKNHRETKRELEETMSILGHL